MHPNWHDQLHVPTVGDDVRIISPHMITVTPSAETPVSFQVAVQPKSTNGVLSPHAKALAALLKRVHEDTAHFVNRHLQPSTQQNDLDDLRVDLKNILENYRSSLEYVAHHLANRCVPKPSPDRVQFPIASAGDNIGSFSTKIDKWFPGLCTSSTGARDHLLSIQEFSGDFWLRQLADLSNFNKHRSLSSLESTSFRSVVVKFGSAGLRFGELGFRSCSIEMGGILRFAESAENYIDLTGPYVLNAGTTSLPNADARIKIIPEERNLYGIPRYTESVAGLVWTIGKNVFRTIDRLCGHLS